MYSWWESRLTNSRVRYCVYVNVYKLYLKHERVCRAHATIEYRNHGDAVEYNSRCPLTVNLVGCYIIVYCTTWCNITCSPRWSWIWSSGNWNSKLVDPQLELHEISYDDGTKYRRHIIYCFGYTYILYIYRIYIYGIYIYIYIYTIYIYAIIYIVYPIYDIYITGAAIYIYGIYSICYIYIYIYTTWWYITYITDMVSVVPQYTIYSIYMVWSAAELSDISSIWHIYIVAIYITFLYIYNPEKRAKGRPSATKESSEVPRIKPNAVRFTSSNNIQLGTLKSNKTTRWWRLVHACGHIQINKHVFSNWINTTAL